MFTTVAVGGSPGPRANLRAPVATVPVCASRSFDLYTSDSSDVPHFYVFKSVFLGATVVRLIANSTGGSDGS